MMVVMMMVYLNGDDDDDDDGSGGGDNGWCRYIKMGHSAEMGRPLDTWVQVAEWYKVRL